MLDRPGRGGKHALLLTGPPGVGKTTVVRRVARVGRQRLGFRLETFDGRSFTLAHVDMCSRHQVGKYRVDVATLDDLVGSTLALDSPAEAYLIDEIGRARTRGRSNR